MFGYGGCGGDRGSGGGGGGGHGGDRGDRDGADDVGGLVVEMVVVIKVAVVVEVEVVVMYYWWKKNPINKHHLEVMNVTKTELLVFLFKILTSLFLSISVSDLAPYLLLLITFQSF